MVHVTIEQTTPVHLTEEEVRQFLSFQQHRQLFKALDKARVLGMANGSYEVHLDKDGRVSVIDVHSKLRF